MTNIIGVIILLCVPLTGYCADELPAVCTQVYGAAADAALAATSHDTKAIAAMRKVVRDSTRETHNQWLSLARAKANPSGLYIYTVAIPVSRKESPTSIPPELGFDLQADPRDICMRFEGRYLWRGVTSNQVRLTKADIRSAFDRIRETPPN
jgi:hypothetical protein